VSETSNRNYSRDVGEERTILIYFAFFRFAAQYAFMRSAFQKLMVEDEREQVGRILERLGIAKEEPPKEELVPMKAVGGVQ
jgi:hypothetical protein